MTLGTYLAEAGKALRTNLPRAWVEAIVLNKEEIRFWPSVACGLIFDLKLDNPEHAPATPTLAVDGLRR